MQVVGDLGMRWPHSQVRTPLPVALQATKSWAGPGNEAVSEVGGHFQNCLHRALSDCLIPSYKLTLCLWRSHDHDLSPLICPTIHVHH